MSSVPYGNLLEPFMLAVLGLGEGGYDSALSVADAPADLDETRSLVPVEPWKETVTYQGSSGTFDVTGPYPWPSFDVAVSLPAYGFSLFTDPDYCGLDGSAGAVDDAVISLERPSSSTVDYYLVFPPVLQ